MEEISRIDRALDRILAPPRVQARSSLDDLVRRRLNLQAWQSDREEAARLRKLRGELDEMLPSAGHKQTWASIDSVAITALCHEIEAVLHEWSWPPNVRVEFDEKSYDIKVDGKARRSHGKGFRAVVNSALAIGLLRYCQVNTKPHPKFLILDSPLTTVKQRDMVTPADDPDIDARINQTIEPLFWDSLSKIPEEVQIIVLDNKEPSSDVAKLLNLQIFYGPTAGPNERAGFIPPTSVSSNDGDEST